MLERKRKLDCANGREKADLVLKNGNVLMSLRRKC